MDGLSKLDETNLEKRKKQQIEDFFTYTKKSKCSNSIRAYEFAWAKFIEWLTEHGYDMFKPPASSYELLIGLFISSMAKQQELKPASLSAYLAGIKHFYLEQGINVDTRHQEIRKAMTGIRRELGTRQVRKIPLLTENIKLLIDSFGKKETSICIRDKAIILIGFAGAFRRSELVSIDFEHLSFDPQGVSILIPNSKTDQEGEGRTVDIPFTPNEPYCPVRALKKWLTYAQIDTGPIFLQTTKGGKIIRERLGDRSVALRLKKWCMPFGFSNEVAGHSLRAGHVTSSIKKGTPETWIMRQTGHTNVSTLRKYERLNKEFDANSAANIGL
jgi:integrase